MIHQAHRDGALVVVSPGFDLPGRCVKCNAECSSLRINLRISTFSVWYPLFCCAGWNAHCADDLPIFITFSLCLRHRLAWLGRIALTAFVCLLNIFCFAICWAIPNLGFTAELLALILPLLLLAALMFIRPALRPRRVRDGQAWLAGAGAAFLESLPDLETQVKAGRGNSGRAVLS